MKRQGGDCGEQRGRRWGSSIEIRTGAADKNGNLLFLGAFVYCCALMLLLLFHLFAVVYLGLLFGVALALHRVKYLTFTITVQ